MKNKKIIAFVLLAALMCSTNIAYASDGVSETGDTKDARVMATGGEYLNIDFEEVVPEFSNPTGGNSPKYSFETEKNGSRYLSITSNYTNYGYKLNSVIPYGDTYYEINFDFFGKDMVGGLYKIMLSERAKEEGGDNTYHQFGLLRVTDDKKFRIAGCTTDGMKYEEGKWYNYKLIFNSKLMYVDLIVTDKENPERTAKYQGNVSASTGADYGNTLPAFNYDTLKFTCEGTVNIDNIVIKESRENGLLYDLSTEHAGNIFDGDNEKKFHLKYKNVLNSPVKANINYEVYNVDGNKVDEGFIGSSELKPGEEKETDFVAKVTRYDCYDLYIKSELEIEGEEQKYKCETKNIMFSVANKLDEGDELNQTIGVNIREFGPEGWETGKELLLQAGVSGFRKDFKWENVEPYPAIPGKYDPNPKNHSYYKDAVSSGLENMIILDNGVNVLYSDTGENWNKLSFVSDDTPKRWEGYKTYIDYLSKSEKYKDEVTYWQVLNEPNWHFSPEFYCKVLKTTYEIIKKNDPDAVVVGLNTGSVPWSWIEECFQIMDGKCNEYMDVIAIHPYDFDQGEYRTVLTNTNPWSTVLRDYLLEDKISQLKDLMAKYNCDMPIQVTELGITSTPKVRSMRGQAADCVQMVAVMTGLESIQKYFWYGFENSSVRGYEYVRAGNATEFTEANFGLVGNKEDPVPYAAKPAYIALTGYNKLIGNAKVVDKIVKDKTRIYKFQKADGKQIIMIWRDEQSENVSLKLGTGSIDVYDIYTNHEGTIKSGNGIYDFTANLEPIYISGDFKSFELTDGNIVVDNANVTSVVNDICTFNYTDKRNRNLRIEAQGTPYAKIEKVTDIKNGKGSVVVKTMNGAFEEEAVTVKIYSGENLVYYGKAYAVIKEGGLKASYSVGDDPMGTKRTVINLSVTNETAGNELSGIVEVDFTKLGGKVEKRRVIGLKPGETKTVYLNLPKTPYIKNVASTAQIRMGGGFGIDKEVSIIQDISVAYNTTGKKDASVFDGNYETVSVFAADDEYAAKAYESVFKQTWGGTGDCSFKGSLLWDEENLYIKCEVKDDIHYQTDEGTNIWKGDCLQIGVQDAAMIGQGVGDTQKKFAELGVALSNGKKQAYRWSAHPSTSMNVGNLENYDLKVERTGTRTIYKFAIPWTEIIGKATVKEGDTYRFSIIANDNDGQERRGYMALTDGIGDAKDAERFSKIILVK